MTVGRSGVIVDNNNNNTTISCGWLPARWTGCKIHNRKAVGLPIEFHHGSSAILSKLLTYFVLRSNQPPTLSGMGNE